VTGLPSHSTLSPIEGAFSRVVASAGGTRVEDILPSGTNLPSNADFVFVADQVIAELKILKRSALDMKEFSEQLSPLYREWIRDGKVPPAWGTNRINLRDLPSDCANEALSILRRPIYRRVRKANEQIKSTKRLLNMPDATGLLILIQDGDSFFSPEMVLHLLYRTLNTTNFLSHVDDIIYANGKLAAMIPTDRLRYQFFLHSRRNESRGLPKNLINNLSAAWRSELPDLIGSSIDFDHHGGDLQLVESFRYVRGM
jgi:hypothetical protein